MRLHSTNEVRDLCRTQKRRDQRRVEFAMTELLCNTSYEVAHVRPAEPVYETCQEALPVADGDAWLTYRLVPSSIDVPLFCASQ
jgi:hypothetical protein